MAFFDLEKTALLEQLFRVPREARDARWIRAMYAAAPEASLKTGSQQLINGPDGFPYLALYLPAESEPFDAFCISQVVGSCLEHGVGCVICPDQSSPEWVFTYGNLWSLHSYQTFDRRPDAPEADEPTGIGREVMMSSPSENFLPGYARNVLTQYFKRFNLNDVGVMLISDARATPAESLAFSIYQEDFESNEVFAQVMGRLKDWFLPPHYGLMALPKNSEYESYFRGL